MTTNQTEIVLDWALSTDANIGQPNKRLTCANNYCNEEGIGLITEPIVYVGEGEILEG